MGKILIWAAVVIGIIGVGMAFFRGPSAKIAFTAESIPGLPGFITDTMLASWLSIAVLLVIAFLVTGFSGSRLKLVPTGLQNAFEYVFEIFLNLCETIAGPKNGRRIFPLIFTLFLFIMISGWLSLLPGFKTIGIVEPVDVVETSKDGSQVFTLKAHSPTATGGVQAVEGSVIEPSKTPTYAYGFREANLGPLRVLYLPPNETLELKVDPDTQKLKGVEKYTQGTATGNLVPFLRSANTDLNTPLALAITAIIFVQFFGFSTLGVTGYGGKFIAVQNLFKGKILNGVIDMFIGVIEIIGEFSRILSFTFRLFGNMFAGLVLLIVISAIVPFVAPVPFLGLEAFVSVVQGLVFAMLTLVFAAGAMTSHHGDEHGDDHGHGHVDTHGEHTHSASPAAH